MCPVRFVTYVSGRSESLHRFSETLRVQEDTPSYSVRTFLLGLQRIPFLLLSSRMLQLRGLGPRGTVRLRSPLAFRFGRV